MDPTGTFLLDENAIKRRLLLDPAFSKLLVLWHQEGAPDQWYLIETIGGQFSQFDLDEFDLKLLKVEYQPSFKTVHCNQFYFSDLVKAMLVE